MPQASTLIFWPPEEEMKDYEGRMHEWNPTSEEVADLALFYELNISFQADLHPRESGYRSLKPSR